MGRRTRALMAVTLLLAACGQARSSPSPAVPDDLLYLTTGDGLELVSAATGRTIGKAAGGVASPDFETIVATRSGGGRTEVRWLDRAGAEQSRRTVPGDVQARIVSYTGTVVLTEPAAPESGTYAPVGRSSTRVVVASPHGPVDEYDLRGNFEPEAFSTDGRQLFMLEYLPALAPTRYRVRRLVLAKGRVVPIGRLKTAAPEQMQGTGRAQVYAPDGRELYTLYTQQESAGHDAGAFSGDHAFVHLLNLEGSWTHCIDLPHTFGHGEATASALALSPDGARLFVVDWSSGVVAVARPSKVDVVDTATVAFGAPDDRTFAQASDDRLYVGGGDEVVVLDATTLEVTARWSMPAEVTGLALSDDGERLNVAAGDVVTAVDADDGRVLRETSVPGADGLAHAASS